MKPQCITTEGGRDSCEHAVSRHDRAPITDYSYHSVAFGESSGRYLRNPAQSFWNIADNYLKGEARHEFQSEAILFAFITVTAALPLINNGHALIEFVRAITPH
ncbi:MAG TPA: hypothetical protein VH330_08885 [Candidatus Udaeobacter sp.]|jgi:hypothetical protein